MQNGWQYLYETGTASRILGDLICSRQKKGFGNEFIAATTLIICSTSLSFPHQLITLAIVVQSHHQ